MHLGYISNNFIVKQSLIWFITLFDIGLCDFKLHFSSCEFVWEGGETFIVKVFLTWWKAECGKTASLYLLIYTLYMLF